MCVYIVLCRFQSIPANKLHLLLSYAHLPANKNIQTEFTIREHTHTHKSHSRDLWQKKERF